MLLQAILRFISDGIFLILHVSGNSEFPPPLSRHTEDELLEKWYVHKDKAAKDKLIEHNLRLVAHVVKKYNTLPAEQDDLISIGTIGLIKAINSYTPNKKTRLSTFAAKCIEKTMLSQRLLYAEKMRIVSLKTSQTNGKGFFAVKAI